MPPLEHSRIAVATIGLLGILAVASPIRAADYLRTVALTGAPVSAPELGQPIAFQPTAAPTLVSPLLNNHGLVAFEVLVQGPIRVERGIFTEGGGAGLRGYMRSDYGTTLQAFNDQGQTVFTHVVAVYLSGQDIGIYRYDGPGDLMLVARTHRYGNSSGNFEFIELPQFSEPTWANVVSLSDDGRVVLPAQAYDPRYNDFARNGIWREDTNSGFAAVVRTGDLLPENNCGNAEVFQIPQRPIFAANRLGRIAFIGNINNASSMGVWSEQAAGLQLEARSGSPAPGVDGATFQSYTPFASQPALAFNSRGNVVLQARVSGTTVNFTNDVGLWRNRGDGLSLIVREGDQAPGATAGHLFQSFWSPVLNSRGDIAFVGTARESTGTEKTGIWSDARGQGLELIAFTGVPAPGTEPGVLFASPLNLGTRPLGPPFILNAQGQLAFQNLLTGPGVDSTNDAGIWAQDRTGLLRLVAREGDSLNVSDDPLHPDWRTISGLFLSSASGNDDGRRSWFNDHGQLAFWASFTDDTHGVFVSDLATVPEPATAVLLVIALAAGLLRVAHGRRSSLLGHRAVRKLFEYRLHRFEFLA